MPVALAFEMFVSGIQERYAAVPSPLDQSFALAGDRIVALVIG